MNQFVKIKQLQNDVERPYMKRGQLPSLLDVLNTTRGEVAKVQGFMEEHHVQIMLELEKICGVVKPCEIDS
jgi:hypothetical protein